MSGFYPGDTSFLDTAGRLLIVAAFVAADLRNLSRYQIVDHVRRLALAGARFPRQLFWIGTALEFFGCALVLFDVQPALGVFCLIVFTMLTTFLLLRFWETNDPAKRSSMQNGFLSNVAVCGGLLLLLRVVT